MQLFSSAVRENQADGEVDTSVSWGEILIYTALVVSFGCTWKGVLGLNRLGECVVAGDMYVSLTASVSSLSMRVSPMAVRREGQLSQVTRSPAGN